MAKTHETLTILYGGRGALTLRVGDQVCIFSPSTEGKVQTAAIKVAVDPDTGRLPARVARNLAKMVANGTIQVHGVTLDPVADYETTKAVRACSEREF